jgi:hypothetical protein
MRSLPHRLAVPDIVPDHAHSRHWDTVRIPNPEWLIQKPPEQERPEPERAPPLLSPHRDLKRPIKFRILR